jgi:hypothetical protein
MDKPKKVCWAIWAVWVSLSVNALFSLVCKLAGRVSEGQFMAELLLLALCCIIPYKLNNRSNAARYVYVILFVLSILTMLAGVGSKDGLQFVFNLLALPLDGFAVYCLLQKESNAWFSLKHA